MGYLKYLNPLYLIGRTCEYIMGLVSLGGLDEEEGLESLLRDNEEGEMPLGELELPEDWGEGDENVKSIPDFRLIKLRKEPVHISKLPEDILD